MSICQGVTKTNQPCRRKVLKDDLYCVLHRSQNQGSTPTSAPQASPQIISTNSPSETKSASSSPTPSEARSLCHGRTKAGDRCKCRAAEGELYCGRHKSQDPSAVSASSSTSIPPAEKTKTKPKISAKLPEDVPIWILTNAEGQVLRAFRTQTRCLQWGLLQIPEKIRDSALTGTYGLELPLNWTDCHVIKAVHDLLTESQHYVMTSVTLE